MANLPPVLVSENQALTIAFASDSFTEYSGFQANISFVSADSVTPPPPGQCAGNCGLAQINDCFCDAACLGFGDCCDDFVQECATCQGGGCGQTFTGCACDADCIAFDDCCQGFVEECEKCSTPDRECGEWNFDVLCQCDEECVEFGDCCSDFEATCPCNQGFEICPDVTTCPSRRLEAIMKPFGDLVCDVCQCVECPIPCDKDCEHTSFYKNRYGCDVCRCLDKKRRRPSYGGSYHPRRTYG